MQRCEGFVSSNFTLTSCLCPWCSGGEVLASHSLASPLVWPQAGLPGWPRELWVWEGERWELAAASLPRGVVETVIKQRG